MKTNSYENKVVLITGGTSGIGKATALAFANAGAKVVLTGRRKKEGTEVVAEIKKRGGIASFFKADGAEDSDVRAAVDFVLATYDRLDIAFNNAGVEASGPLDQVTEEQYRKVFDINVWGVLNSMKHEVAAMLKTGGGAIVNTSSALGHVGIAQASIYVASKHAVEGLTKAVALEFAKDNIRVNTVAPAGVATDMTDRTFGKESAGRDGFTAAHPVGRLGTSEEIAAAVLYLCSGSAGFTTGSSLAVDGGFRAS
jgi:NAD(P)-dependent dehydrogenase (short-subunit alcohol dehydrogenase family)